AALLPVMALARFEPEINDIVDSVAAKIERTKKKVKANSDDGRMVNFLWEKLEAKLYQKYNTGKYYFLNRVDERKNQEGELITTVPRALIATRIKEQTGFTYKKIRKILDSLSIAPDDVPSRIRVGGRQVRAVWFRPYQMEKQLREFVMDYEKWQLYNIMGLPKRLDKEISG
ncbi:MAG: hypothetical protein U9O89_00260, partial [Thermoproteota archaeon]|nr:hypothetical protein [Thermoproteota archaeon]